MDKQEKKTNVRKAPPRKSNQIISRAEYEANVSRNRVITWAFTLGCFILLTPFVGLFFGVMGGVLTYLRTNKQDLEYKESIRQNYVIKD